MAVLCRPVGYSWLDASAIATEDKREVNPGLEAWVGTMGDGGGDGDGDGDEGDQHDSSGEASRR